MASSAGGQQINDGAIGGYIKFEPRTTPLSRTAFSQLINIFDIRVVHPTNLHVASRQTSDPIIIAQQLRHRLRQEDYLIFVHPSWY
jgi:hypothetical protein